jgi:hypothetical protein
MTASPGDPGTRANKQAKAWRPRIPDRSVDRYKGKNMTLYRRWRGFVCCLLILSIIGCLAPAPACAAQIVISGRDANGNWRPASLREAAPALLNFLKPYSAPALGVIAGVTGLALGAGTVTALLAALGVGVGGYFGMSALSRLLSPSSATAPASRVASNQPATPSARSSAGGPASTATTDSHVAQAPGRVDLLGVTTSSR